MSPHRAIGPLRVEVSATGVTRVRFGAGEAPPRDAGASGDSSEPSLRSTGAPSEGPNPRDPELVTAALVQIREYLAGERRRFDLPLDLTAATPFRRRVLRALLDIPYGETRSYAEIARRVGCASPRAVGGAVGWNPLPILVPCHRVIASDGGLGGFSGGLDRKRALLSLEKANVAPAAVLHA